MTPAIRRAALIFVAMVAASAASAAGLTPIPPAPPPTAGPAPAAGPLAPTLPAAPPPYEAQFLRLSEILGAVHYLRQLCHADDSTVWRDEMQKLLDAERPEADRRARLVDRFNRGYNSFRSVYLTCTPAATEATQRYLDEGAKITTDVTARYGR